MLRLQIVTGEGVPFSRFLLFIRCCHSIGTSFYLDFFVVIYHGVFFVTIPWVDLSVMISIGVVSSMG